LLQIKDFKLESASLDTEITVIKIDFQFMIFLMI
jgi:hypothetical protein